MGGCVSRALFGGSGFGLPMHLATDCVSLARVGGAANSEGVHFRDVSCGANRSPIGGYVACGLSARKAFGMTSHPGGVPGVAALVLGVRVLRAKKIGSRVLPVFGMGAGVVGLLLAGFLWFVALFVGYEPNPGAGALCQVGARRTFATWAHRTPCAKILLPAAVSIRPRVCVIDRYHA
jgi:hypothetical protein